MTTLKPRACRTEGSDDGDVDCIAPARDEDTVDARRVVPGVECVTAAAKINLEPRAEVHGRVLWRNADVAEIAGAIAGRNVNAAAERDRKMREVAANASPLSEDFEKRSWEDWRARSRT